MQPQSDPNLPRPQDHLDHSPHTQFQSKPMLSPRHPPTPQLYEGTMHTPYPVPPRVVNSGSYGMGVGLPSVQSPPAPMDRNQYMYPQAQDGWQRAAQDAATVTPLMRASNSNGRQSPYENSDGSTLPALSSVLHSPWSPPRWQQPQQQQQQHPIESSYNSSQPVPASYGQSRGHSLLLRPTEPPQGRRSMEWQGDCRMKSEPNSPFSPVLEAHLVPEDFSLDARRRGSCSSTSSFSTGSAFGEGDHDSEPKISASLDNERKASRYLREMDRRAILERLARGEKQATLAKEYHVSRAAICNLYKHRHEVMARTDEDPFAKHPKKRKNKKTLKNRRSRSLRLTANSTPQENSQAVVTPPSGPSRVHQVQSDAVLLLLTVMSDRRSSVEEFRRASERVLWLLIEDSLAVVPIKLAQVTITAEAKVMGVTTEHPPCAISMEQHSSPMLEVYQLLEPDRPHGRIKVNGNGLELSDNQLPATLKYHNVFLFDVAVVSSDSVRSMIECVKQRGALEVMIYIVALFISADVVETLQQVYPHVQIVTTQIESHVLEPQKSRRSCVDVVLGRFDQVYETQYTLV